MVWPEDQPMPSCKINSVFARPIPSKLVRPPGYKISNATSCLEL